MSAALTRVSMDTARLLGVDAHEYVNLLGLAPEQLDDDGCRVPSATNIRLAELSIARVPWNELAVRLASRSPIGSLGVWDYLITSAATPLEGIREASDLFATVADTGTDSLSVTVDGDHVTVSHTNRADVGHEAACAIRAFGLGLYRRRLCEAAARDLVPLRVSLATKAPHRHDNLIELYGTRSIDFEAPVSSITFLVSDLTVPNPLAQPGLSTVLRRHAEHTLTAAVPLHSWLDLFRSALASSPDQTAPTLAAVARHMGLSTRTLQRRLDEHGTSWSRELEDGRRDHVTRLLHDTTLSIDAVAARTGYADARALRRAVRRWHGTTPAALRHGA